MTIICTGRCARGLRGKVATIVGLLMLLNGSIDAAIFMVENADDAGLGSLRQAILSANATPGADTIRFAITTGPQSIALTSELPADAAVSRSRRRRCCYVAPVYWYRGTMRTAIPALRNAWAQPRS